MSNFYAARFAAASVLVGMGMMFFGARVALSFAICAADFFFFFSLVFFVFQALFVGSRVEGGGGYFLYFALQ